MIKITLEQVTDGYKFNIEGVNRINGERVRQNDKLEEMLCLIGEAVLGFKIDVVRR